MKKFATIAYICGLSLACSQGSAATQDVKAQDISLPGAQTACGKESALIGKTFAFSTIHHGVEGNVTVVDDCTLSITDFFYDGKGLQVEIYSAVDGDFTGGQALSQDLLRPEQAYVNDSLILRLPGEHTVDTIEGLSVWCTDAAVSFGDLFFSVKSF